MKNHVGLIESYQKSLEISESDSALECQNYVPFAESIIEKIDMRQGIEKAEFMFRLAFLLHYIADYKKAEKLYQQNLEIYKQELGENYPDTVTNYTNLGGVYESQKKYKMALVYYLKAYKIFVFS